MSQAIVIVTTASGSLEITVLQGFYASEQDASALVAAGKWDPSNVGHIEALRAYETRKALQIGYFSELLTASSLEGPAEWFANTGFKKPTNERESLAYHQNMTSAVLRQLVEETGMAAAAPVGALAIGAKVILGLGLTASVGWVAVHAQDVIGGAFAKVAETVDMMRRDSLVCDLAQKHIEREKAAGSQLPLDEATKAAIDALGKAQIAAFKSKSSSGALPGWVLPVVGLVVVGGAVYLTQKRKQ